MRSPAIILLLTAFIFSLANLAHARTEIKVKGVGWREDRRIERLLEDIMSTTGDREPVLDAAMLEDALLILRSEVVRMGYLSARIDYSLSSGSTEIAEGSWDLTTTIDDLPDTAAHMLHLRVEKGVRAHLKEVQFTGLQSITDKEAREFFIPSGGLLVTASERAYSPSRLQAGMRLLGQRLGQLGYLKAAAKLKNEVVILATGEVSAAIEVAEGPLHVWGKASVKGGNAAGVGELGTPPESGTRFTVRELQDWISVVRRHYLFAGYPDVAIQTDQKSSTDASSNRTTVDVALTVTPGQRIRLGTVTFSGVQYTRERFLRRQTGLESGNWLSRPDVQSAQFKLGQLGIFGRVQREYNDAPADGDAPVRDVRFSVSERKRQSFSLLSGYGSYEQLRMRAEARALNVLGMAHSAHLRLRQSMKSSAGSLYYTVPRPVSWLTSAQLRIQGLVREEVSFDREEALLAAGIERNFLGGSIGTTLEYRYELLQSKGFASTFVPGDPNTSAGSMNIGFSWDTRDQIVMPRTGASLHGVLELASTVIGSQADFQRFQVRASYHRPLVDDWLRCHLGIEGGALTRLGSDPVDLPTNKRFLPGGKNSIRG